MTEENGTPKPDDAAAAKKEAKIAAAKKAAAEKAAAEPKMPWEEKPIPPTHEDGADDEDGKALAEAVDGAVISTDIYAGEPTIFVAAGTIVESCRFLKEQKDYTFLVDLTAIDWPERDEGRFDVVYWMHRFSDSKRLRLRTIVDGDTIASVSSVWKTANWMEREAYDMFGIIFDEHPGLERILTWEGFNGHPLRKDFPVEGIDTGAAIYPDVFPAGGGPVVEEEKGDAK
jgi:NADH-quinone oxidoreductase subunit C